MKLELHSLVLVLAVLLGACRTAAVDWRTVAQSSVIVVGRLDVPAAEIEASRKSGVYLRDRGTGSG